MNAALLAFTLSLWGQSPSSPPVALPPLPSLPPVPSSPSSSPSGVLPPPVPFAKAGSFDGNLRRTQAADQPAYGGLVLPDPTLGATLPDPDASAVLVPPPVAPPAVVDPNTAANPEFQAIVNNARGLFESDHAFDGFTGPMSNPVQFKDPRSLTEARFLFMNDYARPGTPVIGRGTAQVYALQLRIALTERLQIFADKDGIVRISPSPGKSITGLAALMAGVKYVLIRDVENQFLVSAVVQYEAPSGYANIYQDHGGGLLGVYAVVAKQFFDNYHVLLQFGENVALTNEQSGYFLTSLHVDRRFGRLTPFYEANWFYYNQPGKYLPLGIEGGGWINLGSQNINGMNYVTNAFGTKFDVTRNIEAGLAYEFQVSNRVQLLNNMLHAQLIFRY